MENKLVSVIIPCYNAEKYILRYSATAGIKPRLTEILEVIVVD